MQNEERGKLVCQPDGYYPSLTSDDVTVSNHCFKLNQDAAVAPNLV